MATEYALQFEAAEPGGKAIAFVPDDPRLQELIKGRGDTKVRVAPTDEGDSEGHALSTTVSVRAMLGDDDTEGHAISLNFPTRQDADAFRRRLLAAGVLTGAIAVGTIGAVGVANLPADQSATGAGQAAVTQAGPMDAHEAPAFQAGAAATQAGPMDAHEAPAFQAGAAATQAGPMDAHEAPAFQAGAAATQAGPMDAHEAPAFQAGAAATQAGPMDAHEAPAFQADQSSGAADEESTGGRGIQPE